MAERAEHSLLSSGGGRSLITSMISRMRIAVNCVRFGKGSEIEL
jgi:hypothetical protein